MILLPTTLYAAAPPLIETIGGERPVELRHVNVNTHVSGSIAETTIEMVLFNPNKRALEGTIHFPLAEGQKITGFALDMHQHMRPAVPIDKAKGRQIFEDIQRQNIDPALLEQTQGNNFQLRIYPIAAKGSRTARFTYIESLGRRSKHWVYRLPLAFGAYKPSAHVTVKVNGTPIAPTATTPFGPMPFLRKGTAFLGTLTRDALPSHGALQITMVANNQAQTFVQERDGETYFLTEIPVDSKAIPRRLPKVVGILLDMSGSARHRHLDAELHELGQYLRALGTAEVRLIRLRDRSSPVETYRVTKGEWKSLHAALSTRDFDGATALGNWQPQSDVDEYILLSDGLDNYGNVPFPALSATQRLYALNSSPIADVARLRALAERAGGRYIPVQADRPGAAAHALLHDGARLSDLEAMGVDSLQIASREAEDGLIRIAGKLTALPARLSLELTRSKAGRLVIPIQAEAPDHPLAAYFWAVFKLRQLEADYEFQRAEIRRIGKTFGIATRETSLIVLDDVMDYVRHDVDPPAELRAEVEKAKAVFRHHRAESRAKHMEQVVREFQGKLAWWEKSYPKGERPAPLINEREEARRHAPAGAPPRELFAMRMPAAPMPAPAAPASTPAAADAGAPPRQRQESATGNVGITLKKWEPNAPYLARMRAAEGDAVYRIYLDEKKDYENSSAFYLDVADVLLQKDQRDLALRVLSNLAEMQLENRHVLRVLGYRLLQAQAADLAIPIFQQVLMMGEEEPQSFRDLSLAYTAAGRLQEAIDQLHEVTVRPWHGRFAEIGLIALAEMNAIIATAAHPLDTSRIDARLLKNMPLDLRVVLTWDADNSDMDLWVTDPNGEKCYYQNRLTYQGGRMSRDFTGGYGPEEFSLRVAKPGKYKVEANFFGSRQQIVAGATTLQLQLITGFGTKDVKTEMVTMRLKDRGEHIFVGEFEVKGSAAP